MPEKNPIVVPMVLEINMDDIAGLCSDQVNCLPLSFSLSFNPALCF